MLLAFDSIELAFHDRQILSSIAMKCETGEVVGLLGRNGSGKSCLLQIVFGSMTPQYKSVRVDHRTISSPLFTTGFINYLPQTSLIPTDLRIANAVSFFGVQPEAIAEHFPPVEQGMTLKPNQCSGGSLRLLETLLVLLSPAPFCLLDEPFSGLMPVHVEQLKRIIAIRKKEKGIIITDHLYRHITDVADRLAVLSNGKTYQVSSQTDLIRYGYLNE